MRIVFFDTFIHFGGGTQLGADTIKRLAALDDVDIEVIDAYGVCDQYIEKLKEAGIKFSVMLPDVKRVWIGYRNKKLMRLWRMLCQIPTYWRLRRRIIRKICEINPDIIWSNSPTGSLFLGMSFSLLRYPLAREYIGCPDAASIPRYDRWLLKHRINVVMCISTETARQLQLAGVPEGKLKIVFDTIEVTDTLKRSTQSPEASLPGIDKHPRIVVPATLTYRKGQHAVVKSIARLKSQGLNPVLWLAGDAPGNDQSYMAYLHQLVDELSLSDNVYFLGWRNDVPAIIIQADIVVLPSHVEGFGHVVLEAMLLRRPIVATPVGGIKDSIEDGVNGLLFSVDDDEKLAAHLKRLSTDNQYVSMLIENGYRTATQRFSPENHTKKVMEALSSIQPLRCG